MTAIWAENLLNLQKLDLEIRNLKLRLTILPKEAEELQLFQTSRRRSNSSI